MTAGPAPAEPLTDLLREFSAQLAEWDLWKSDPRQAFENLAAEFYRETGLLVPGKSVPLEMANADDDALRRQRYTEWSEARRVRRQAMLRRVEQALAEHATQQIDCPLCGKTIQQVASATLSLALWQHVNWTCEKFKAHATQQAALRELIDGLRKLDWCIGYELTEANATALDNLRDRAFQLAKLLGEPGDQ